MLHPLGYILLACIMAKAFGFLDVSWWLVFIPLWYCIIGEILKGIFYKE